MIDEEVIGRYRLQRRLGSGAFATVWLARDETLDALVAIKVLAENWAYRADVHERFVEEARLLRRADSDRVVRVFDISELDDGRPYFVMSYANAGTLAERLAAGPLEIAEAVAIGVRVAEAVAVLHAAGIIHRDVKPSNVLFHDTATGQRLLIADLGLAKETAYASGFTVAAGTPGYRAPEQARPGGGLDARADVYALTALTYRMLTGHTPDGAPSGTLGAPDHIADNGAVTPASALRPSVPAGLDDVLQVGLATDPDARYSSAAALAEALAACQCSAEEAHPGSTGGRRRPRRGVLAALVLVALLVVAVVSLVTVRPGVVDALLPGHGSGSGPVRVADAHGRISLAVPAAWQHPQVRGAGWNPATIGLGKTFGTTTAPGLAVSPDLSRWRDPGTDVPGVLVGLTDQPHPNRDDLATLVEHPRCTRAGHSRPVTAGELRGTALRWTRCAGGRSSFTEALLYPPGGAYGVYVQIKQTGGHPDTRAILGSLHITAP